MKVEKQPEINIGLVGHVDHGKTTLTKTLSGEWTDRHSEEIKRGISIRLGYADTAFYRCTKCKGPEGFTVKEKCPTCGGKTKFLRAVSFVDSPGHETLMATMLSGAALMDGALLIIAANEKCPQPQSREHLMALEITGVENIVIVQNKIDLVTAEEARQNHEDIKAFVKGSIAENAPIIPVSAHHEMNIDFLISMIEDVMPTPKRDVKKPFRMFTARSFDINKPGTGISKLTGGVLGGSLSQGTLKIGDPIEIRPGMKIEEGGKTQYRSITTNVISLMSGGKTIKEANSGGLIAIGTSLDPFITKSDSLTGNLAGKPGTLPEIRDKITIDTKLLDHAIGTAGNIKVEALRTNEPLMLSVGAATTVGVVSSAREGVADLSLKLPVCVDEGQRVAISRRVGTRWHLIGYGIIQ